MAQVDYKKKEISAKIVYYGPGRSGKTTNLQYVHAKLKPSHRGDLVTLSTEQDRTLFFDFMPMDLGEVAGMRTRFHLYTVPGQVFYNSTRKLVLKNADGIVFVADSQRKYFNDNIESFKNLVENLKAHGMDLSSLPIVIQYNKRDLADAIPLAELEAALNKQYKLPTVEAVAARGEGVLQTLTAVSKAVIQRLRNQSAGETVTGRAGPAPVAYPVHAEPAPAQAPAPTSSPQAAPQPPAQPAPSSPQALELVGITNPRAEGQNELHFSLELRDSRTGKTYVAPVRLSLDLLIRPKE